jgi:hypothetical protein
LTRVNAFADRAYSQRQELSEQVAPCSKASKPEDNVMMGNKVEGREKKEAGCLGVSGLG